MNVDFTNSKSDTLPKTTLFFWSVFLFASWGMLGQNPSSKSTPAATMFPAVEVAYDSEVDLVNWFMSSKQNTLNNQEHSDATNNTKKQIISLGLQPNKVLYRTFLKRITSKDIAVA